MFSVRPYIHIGLAESEPAPVDHNERNLLIFFGYLAAGGFAGHYLAKNVFHFGSWISGFASFAGVVASFASSETVLSKFPVHE